MKIDELTFTAIGHELPWEGRDQKCIELKSSLTKW